MARMKDEELRALLADVESEIGGLIRAERLNKGEGSPPVEETPGEVSPEASPPPPASSCLLKHCCLLTHDLQIIRKVTHLSLSLAPTEP